MTGSLTYPQVAAALEAAGLRARGGFHTGPDETLPAGVRTVILAGNIGGSLWAAFSADRRDEPNPLDGWSKRALGAIAETLPGEVTAVFPSDGPPYMPFQQWAMKSEPVHPSPLGPLVHPDYGLWHAYRGALLFRDRVEGVPEHGETPSPCATCAGRPCLTTCPVGAIDEDEGGLQVMACAGHLKTQDGDRCLAAGCLARRACPVGADHRYDEPQARFHMGAFLRARG